MTVKGYYPSVSLGFEILIAVINVMAGTALLVFGIVLMPGDVARIEGLILVGAAAIPAGILAIAAGMFGFAGSCKESVHSLRAAYILSFIALLAAGGVGGYAMATAGGIAETTRRNWFTLDEDDKGMIEAKYACCGFSSKTESTEGCEPDQTCNDPLVTDLGGKLKTLAIIAAVVAGIQLPAILCGCCVWGKMRKQQEKKMRKAGLDLGQEAKGGYKHKGKKSTPASSSKDKSKR